MPSHEEVRRIVEDAVETSIQAHDYDQVLRNKEYDRILEEVSDKVVERLLDDNARPELNDGDHSFIRSVVGKKVQDSLDEPVRARFEKFERVVCKIGGEVGWAPGTIQALMEDDPQDETGQRKLPYVVKLDPPVGRLISVPYDEQSICRAEVCFGQMSERDLGFSLCSRPQRAEKSRGFAVGDRVACAVEDATGEYTAWAAGTVCDVGYDVEEEATQLGLTWAGGTYVMPYRVLLDGGSSSHVFVHRDVHWLLRDLALQPAGPRQSVDGSRNLKRLVKRRRSDTEWELIDHATRNVRVEAVREGDDEEDSDDE